MSNTTAVQFTLPTTPLESIDTQVQLPFLGGLTCRRTVPRFVPAPGVRVEVRPWGAGAGQDVAMELLDLSELGIRAQLRLSVRVSDRFEVTLVDSGGTPTARAMATIAWSSQSPNGMVVAGLVFGRPLPADVVRRLSGPLIVTDRARDPAVSQDTNS